MLLVCDEGWKPYAIDGQLKCFKVFGRERLDLSAAACQRANAKLILPKNDKQFDDMVTLLKTLDIVEPDYSKVHFHQGIHIKEYAEGGIFVGLDALRVSFYQQDYFDSRGEAVTYFKWGPLANYGIDDGLRRHWNGVGIWIQNNGEASMVQQVPQSRFHIVCEKDPLPKEGKSFK